MIGDREAETYGLIWPGKRAAGRLVATPSTGALLLAQGEGVDEATTQNRFIEGDNLDALKLLQPSYAGRVKLIYIDPPYNTGKDFVYKDDFKESLAAYRKRTGQNGATEEQLTANRQMSGRLHANWLSMIYPRLCLARELLRTDGLIMVSIDDHEVAPLRLLLDETFGEQNFVSQFVWHSSTAGGIRSKHVNKNHEYVLTYARNLDELPMLFAPLSPEAVAQYKRQDDQGPYREKDFAWRNRSDNQKQKYLVQCPDGQLVQPPPGYIFRFVKATFDDALAQGLVVFKPSNTTPLVDETGQRARWNIYIKKYLADGTGAPSSLLPKSLVGISNAGTEELKELFGAVLFNNPKPTTFLDYLLEVGTTHDTADIVLDFFAGAGSTGHAVFKKNRQDGGNRRFILVQLPEPTNHPHFATIAEIGKERLRRASRQMKAEGEPTPTEDLGFQVFKVAPFITPADTQSATAASPSAAPAA
jgi:adenine-specific DNA-methyltransferase